MDGQAFGNNGIDSITLGQLKSLVGGGVGGGQNVKQKVHKKTYINDLHLSSPNPLPPIEQQSYFDFHYEDEDNLFEEMNEFYAFQEVEQLTENLRMWQQTGDFNGGTSVRSTTQPSCPPS